MTDEDRLRNRLHSAASGMPVGSGSVAGVQARAAQLQRRRNAMRGGAGAFALVAVALVGIVSLRNGGPGEFTDSAVATQQEAADDMPATTAAAAAAASESVEEMAIEAMAEEEMAEEEPATATVTGSAVTSQDQPEPSGGAETVTTEPPVSETVEPAVSGESENWNSAQSDDGSPKAAVFATAVSVVKPPPQAQGGTMSYSFSGGHAVAQASDGWYAYDGTDWQTLGVPASLEVAAVDLSASERFAILGVVRPLACAVEHIVGVQTSEGWRFARIEDGTPSIVHSVLLDAQVRVLDNAIEVERTELLSLWEECADGTEQTAPSAEVAGLLEDLELLGEVTRQSWLSVPLEPDVAGHWLRIAHDDAHAAALRESDLDWIHTVAPRLTVPAVELEDSLERRGDDARFSLHETTILDVVTKVEVSDGTAWLHHGDQTWEVCPIPDVDAAHGEVGWAGEHLAVIVGTPEQQLYLLERTE